MNGGRCELFGNDSERCARGLPDPECQVSCLAAHGDHDVPPPGGPPVFDQVAHQLGADVTGGLEAEGGDVFRQGKVIVDGLGDMDGANASLGDLGDVAGRKGGVVATDGRQVCHAELVQR